MSLVPLARNEPSTNYLPPHDKSNTEKLGLTFMPQVRFEPTSQCSNSRRKYVALGCIATAVVYICSDHPNIYEIYFIITLYGW